MFNSAGLTAIIERIIKGDETEADISTCFETLTIIGLQKDDIQSFIRILRESRQQIPKESESNQKIQIILQNVVQLGEKSSNFGNPKDFTVQNIYQGIDTETFEARIQELQQSIHKILIEKNNIESYQSETCVYSSPETQLILSPLPPSNISTFDYEVVTVDIKGSLTKHDSNQAEFFVENLNNEVMLEMVSITGGTFQMGAPRHELGSIEYERPQHLVTLKDFFIGKYPITQAQWRVEINILLQLALSNQVANSKQARALGEVLFDTIFDNALRQDFVNFYFQAVQKEKQLLRVEMDIDEQNMPAVAALPRQFQSLQLIEIYKL